MFPALKKALIPLAVLALILGATAALPTSKSDAAIANGVWFLDDYGIIGSDECEDGDLREIRVFTQGDQEMVNGVPAGTPLEVIQVASTDDIIMCVDNVAADANVVFDTNGGGEWNDAACGDVEPDGNFVEEGDDFCVDEEGVGDDALTVIADGNDIDTIAVTFSCNGASVQTITIDQDDTEDDISFRVMCKGPADSMQLSATPDTVESNPAIYNTSHALLRGIITDAAGNPVLPTTAVDVSTNGCGISATAVDEAEEREEVLDNDGDGNTADGLNLNSLNAEFGVPPLINFLDILVFSDRDTPVPSLTATTHEVDTNDPEDGVPNHSEVLILFHAEGCDPGVYTVSFDIDNPGNANDLEASIDVTVIGPPTFITVTAAPTDVICGEKSEITVTVTDALNRPVSDNTRIEVITNHGGVLAGTGTSLTTVQPVNPLSSTTVEIFDGSGIAYLLTSPEHYGPYEVLAASTPSQFSLEIEDSPRVTAQATVNCILGTDTVVTAPDTGTGQIRPPNTGDAGLASGAAGSASLFAVAGATLIALVAIARRFARD